MFETGGDPSQLLEAEGLTRIVDDQTLRKQADFIITQNPKAAADYYKGKENVIHFLTGQVMVGLTGTASTSKIQIILKEQLERKKKDERSIPGT